MSLRDCLVRAGDAVVRGDREDIIDAWEAYQREGVGADEAAIRAVQDKLDLLIDEERRLVDAVTAQYAGKRLSRAPDETMAAKPETAGVNEDIVPRAFSAAGVSVTNIEHTVGPDQLKRGGTSADLAAPESNQKSSERLRIGAQSGLAQTLEERWQAYSKPVWNAVADIAKALAAKVKLADLSPVEVKRELRRMRAEILQAGLQAAEIAKAGTALSIDERTLISDYIEKELAAGVVPPAHIVRMATQMQMALKSQSDELVRLDMLSQASRDRWASTYLPRFYMKHIIDRAVERLFRKRTHNVKGDHLKARGLFERVPIADATHYLEMGWELRDPNYSTRQQLLDEIESPTFIADEKVTLWRDFTREERESMGEVRDAVYRYARGYMEIAKDIAVGRMFERIAAMPSVAHDHDPGGWRQIPEATIPESGGVRRYGKLSGKWVPPDVWSAIAAVREPRGEAMQAYLLALSLWKGGKTAMNPVVHGNNITSNVVMADFYGIAPWEAGKYLAAWREYRSKGRYYQEAMKEGLFGTEWYGTEIGELMPDIDKLIENNPQAAMEGWMTRAYKAAIRRSGLAKYADVMGKLYQAEDQFFKLMVFMNERDKGAPAQDAIDTAERYFFNYADIPEGVRWLKTWMLPFFSYPYKASQALAYTAFNAPWRLARWVAIFGGLNAVSYALLFGDDDDEREALEREVMPDYMKGRSAIGTPKSIRLPWSGPAGEGLFLDISRRVPAGDLFDFYNQTGGLPIPQPLMPNHPLISTFQAAVMNVDSFTGRELVKDTDSAVDAAERYAQWFANQYLPNIPFLPGSYSFNKLGQGVASALGKEIDLPGMRWTGETRFGDELPLGRAAADVFTGTKVRAVNTERELAFELNDLRRQIADLKQARKYSSPEANRGVTESMGRARAGRIEARIAKLTERIEELSQLHGGGHGATDQVQPAR